MIDREMFRRFLEHVSSYQAQDRSLVQRHENSDDPSFFYHHAREYDERDKALEEACRAFEMLLGKVDAEGT